MSPFSSIFSDLSRTHIFLSIYAVFFNFYDSLTTYYSISFLDAYEKNNIVNYIINKIGLLNAMVFKNILFILLIIGLLFYSKKDEYKNVALYCLVFLFVFYLVVCCHNTMFIFRKWII